MWSGDSTTTPDEIIESVAAAGIDVLCITDHNSIKGAIELKESLPCRVVVGEEMRTHAGEIIGLFLKERIPQGIRPEDAAKNIQECDDNENLYQLIKNLVPQFNPQANGNSFDEN